jgi:hypothetical protein
VCGEDQHGYVRDVAQPLEDLPAVHLGQADVEHHEVGMFRVRLLEAGTPVAGVRHLVAGPAEQQPQGERDVRVVLDHEQAAHASPTQVVLVVPIALPPSCVGGRGAPLKRHTGNAQNSR